MKIYKDHQTRGIFIESEVHNVKNWSYGFPNIAIFNVSSLIMMDNTWRPLPPKIQNRIVSLIVYRIAHSISKWSNQNTNSSVFFIRLKQAKQKQFRSIINEIVTYVDEERETVQQSSDIAISPAFTSK